MALNHPERPAFFITPYQAPASDRLKFQEIARRSWHYQKLQPARLGLPKKAETRSITLTLYRTFAAARKTRHLPNAAWTYAGRNMGCALRAAPVAHAMITGLQLSPNKTALLPAPAYRPENRSADFHNVQTPKKIHLRSRSILRRPSGTAAGAGSAWRTGFTRCKWQDPLFPHFRAWP